MKSTQLLAFLLIVVTFYGCSQRLFKSDRKPEEVNNITLVDVQSAIYSIAKGNRSEYNRGLSDTAKETLTTILTGVLGNKINNQQIHIGSDSKRFNDETSNIIKTIDNDKLLRRLKTPAFIDSFFKANKIAYGIIVWQSGFTRLGNNYENQLTKTGLIAVASLGMYYHVPIKSQSNIRVLIIDSEKSSIAFYRKSADQDLEPLDVSDLKKQCTNIFKGYFFPKDEWKL